MIFFPLEYKALVFSLIIVPPPDLTPNMFSLNRGESGKSKKTLNARGQRQPRKSANRRKLSDCNRFARFWRDDDIVSFPTVKYRRAG